MPSDVEIPSGPAASQARAAALVAVGAALRELGYRFITPTPATHARVNARPGNARARNLADVFGWSRPFEARILPPPLFALLDAAGVLAREGTLYKSTLRASTADGTLLFHSAFPTSAADAVFFGPDTYRFLRALRAAVPALTQAQAQAQAQTQSRCVDIGCGSGAAAIALAAMLPAASIAATDINPRALALTRVNAALAGAVNVQASQGDLLKSLPGQFDLIVANPPYLVDAQQRSYRDGGGVLGGELSLAIVDAAIERLAPGGSLLLYTGAAIVDGADALHAAARARLAQAGFSCDYSEIDADVFGEELDNPAYAQVDRIAAVWLQARRPGTAMPA